MILAVDVDYREWGASIAGIAFENWLDEKETAIYKSVLHEIEDYIPGLFYRRELPCILRLLEQHKLSPDLIVIDGFVYLDGNSAPALGFYLYNALKTKIPVIGVAKKPFKGITQAYEVYRGKSNNPLYVTCAGVSLEEAKGNIRAMYGDHRVPFLLKKADQVCRGK